jgi:aryl-alcohol dehydrogenase-like predicted oxidoreductase
VRYIYGTAGLHRLAWRPARQRLLRIAYDTGFRAFDTAPLYGNGLAETELGVALADLRGKVEITTKFGIPAADYGARHPALFTAYRLADMAFNRDYRAAFDMRDWSVAAMRASVETSLRRLNIEAVDRLCLHEPLATLPPAMWEDLIAEAQSLKAAGKIKLLGLSGEASCVQEMSTWRGLDFVQSRFSRLASFAQTGAPPLTGYGLYGQYAKGATAGAEPFVHYIQGLDRPAGVEALVLSSISAPAVQAYAALFG